MDDFSWEIPTEAAVILTVLAVMMYVRKRKFQKELLGKEGSKVSKRSGNKKFAKKYA